MSDLLRFCAFGLLAFSSFGASRRAGRADRRALVILGWTASILAVLLITDTIGAAVEAIREFARSDGLYQRRRPLQAMVIVFIIIACLAALPALLRIARSTSRVVQIALVLMFSLCGFLVVRAISLHQVDSSLNRHPGLPGLNLGDSVELATTLAIAFLVQWTRRRQRDDVNRPRHADVVMLDLPSRNSRVRPVNSKDH